MGSLDFSGLGDLAKRKAVVYGWRPLKVEDLGHGSVLCFDQSLTATGCLLLTYVFPASAPTVYSATKWSNRHEGTDVETMLMRGEAVFDQAREVIRVSRSLVDAIVHESPPNPKAVKGGGYSSLLAAQALRCAAWAEAVQIEMLGAQPAKKLICGNAVAPKAEAHKALRDVLPWIANSQQVTNEATRDALMLGLLWLFRRKQMEP